MKTIQKLSIVVALLLASIPGFGQTTTTSTTLSAAITSDIATSIQVASATGFTAGSTRLYIPGGEAMDVTSVSGTTIGVRRGVAGTRGTTHQNASTVYVGPLGAGPFVSYVDYGTCTSASMGYGGSGNYTPLIHSPSHTLIRCSNSFYDAETFSFGRINSGMENDLNLQTLADNRQVELNTRNFTQTSGDSIGFRAVPTQSVTSTGTVFGGQVTARLADDIDMGNLIGLHADAFLSGTTAKTVSGDIRALQLELTSTDAGTNTVSGDVNAIRIRAAFSATTLTGDMVPIKIEVAESQTNSQQWDAVFELTGANTGIWASGAASGVGDTEDGYFKIIINGAAQYVLTYSDAP